MARNGSGVYSFPSNGFNPAVSGQTLSASEWNTTVTDLETAISASIAKDGQTTCTARIPFAAGASAFSGTVTSVSYGATGDNNTGIYFPAADKVGIVAGGTEIARAESGQIAPVTNNSIDLGTTSLRFKNGFFAGNLAITGSVTTAGLTLTAPLPVTSGGTGYGTAGSARTSLGVAIGVDVQAYDALLASIAGLTPSAHQYIRATSGTTVTAVTVNDCLAIAVSDETTALTTGTSKTSFRMPFAFTLTGVRASVTTAPTGTALTVDINEGGTSILSTKLTIDATEKTSTTAATPAVISDSALADDAEITIDIDQVGSTVAGAGLKVYLIGRQG